MKKLFASAAIALSFLAFTVSANAAPIQWTLTDVAFDDGGTATGSFVHDADSNTYSNILLKTTAGSAGAASEFRTKCTTAHCATFPSDLFFIASSEQSDLTNVPLLDIELPAPLTNTPGTVDLEFGMSFICGNATCSGIGGSLRVFTAGKLVGAPYIAPPATPTSVPTTSAWGLGLLTVLLAAAALFHRRRNS